MNDSNDSNDASEESTVWEFPCSVNVKVMGKTQFDIKQVVTEVLAPLDPTFDPSTMTTKQSSGAKFVSVTAHVQVKDKNHLETIYQALNDRDEVAWTL